MAEPFAVIGPGKVGQALARRWREAGRPLLGFVGRDPGRVASAVRFCGGGISLDLAACAGAGVVLLAVPDGAIAAIAADAAAAGAVRPGSAWFHASGASGLQGLAPLGASGAHVGSLHPLCPFASAGDGYEALAGSVAVLAGGEPALAALDGLARDAGLDPVVLARADRALYHAACALAANGATVLQELAERWLRAAAPDAGGAARAMVQSLVRGASGACARLGPGAALTGPAARGDGATLRRHAEA